MRRVAQAVLDNLAGIDRARYAYPLPATATAARIELLRCARRDVSPEGWADIPYASERVGSAFVFRE